MRLPLSAAHDETLGRYDKMRILHAISIVAVALLAVPAIAQQTTTPPAGNTPRPPPLVLTTPAFEDGGMIPVQFSQAAEGAAPGEGPSLPFEWTNVPEGTQSFLLHMHDLDAARMGTTEDQLHWLVWNIPGTETGLAEAQPRGRTLANGAFQVSATGDVYRGPGAPASGPLHHYVFELYALDTVLTTEPGEDAFETRRNVMDEVQGHVLGKAVYVGYFRRPS